MELCDTETAALFDLSHTLLREYLAAFRYPWEALEGLKEAIASCDPGGGFIETEEGVFVHGTAEIAPTAQISPPCIICAHAQVRHCAYIRGAVMIGENCVVGNSTELKNAVLFDGAKAPHFNYVGDSILGADAHIGAGAILSNYKSDGSEVVIRIERGIPTGRRKVGAFLGDGAEVGAGAVLNPGSVIGRGSRIYPLTSFRGCLGKNRIQKGDAVFPLRD